MATKTITNYVKHKDELIKLISKGSLCHNCLARTLCKEVCDKKGINTAKTPAPCFEVWKLWCDKKD